MLTPVGAERLLLGVKAADARFTVVTTDASNLTDPGRPSFMWSHAAPIIASLRQQGPDGQGSVVEYGDRYLYRYSMSVAGSSEQVVAGAILNVAPSGIAILHAAVSSAIYTLLPESDLGIPDACVAVSVVSEPGGFSATVAYAGDEGVVRARSTASTVPMSIAQATVEASRAPLRLRFADQIAVGGTPVSLIVADSPVGVVVGSSDLTTPGSIAPALAVLKAANVVARIESADAFDLPKPASAWALSRIS
jgi:hypothetical protein